MPAASSHSIIIADDHEFFRTGFKKIIQEQYAGEIEFMADAANGCQLVEMVSLYHPRIVITDIQMPVMDGVEACKAIKQQHPETAVIAFSMYTDTRNIISMLQAGATGYLAKTSSHQEVAEAIRAVSRDQSYYCSTVSQKIHPFGYTIKLSAIFDNLQ